jgi:hypothetical protein
MGMSTHERKSPPTPPAGPGVSGSTADETGSAHVLPLTGAPPRELGGPTGPEPTRFGDWEKNGRCIDF